MSALITLACVVHMLVPRSAKAFREPDDENTRHHGTVDDRSVRTFAVKPSRLPARPLRGVGA
jgi:hypothetical protein